MKTYFKLALILAPLVAMTFTGCVSAPEGEEGGTNYPIPNKADNAAKMQDAHSKFLRNQM